MPSSYPSGYDSFTTHQDNSGERVTAGDINKIQDGIAALEVELGLAPKGSASDVAARFAGLDQAYAFYVNVTDRRYGAIGDATEYTNVAITSGGATMTRSSGTFPSTVVGKTILVRGAGASSAQLTSTVSARASDGSSITLAVSAGTTVSGGWAVIGTDSTAAFDAARAAGNAVMIPAGGFIYTGNGLEGSRLALLGAGQDATFVYLGTGKSLVKAVSALLSMSVRNIKFRGGYGAIRATSTGASVQSSLVVEDCYFLEYSGAAISSLSVDQPYWKIRNNTFYAVDNAATFGVVLLGDNAGSVIEGNSFLYNGCHIRLGGKGGKSVIVTNNDFIRFGSFTTASRIDLWVSAASGSTVGEAMKVTDNKFGGENSDSRDYRVLVAEHDPATGSDDATRRPLIASQSALTFSGAVFGGNSWEGSSTNGTSPFLTIGCVDVRGVHVRSLTILGAVASNIVKYLFTPGESRQTTGNVAGPFSFQDGMVNGDWSAFKVCSHPGQWVTVDNAATVQEPDSGLLVAGGSDYTSYVSLTSAAITSFSIAGSASVAGATDSLGLTNAGTITVASSGDAVYTSISNGSLTPGVPVYVEFDAKSAGASPVINPYVSLEASGAQKWNRNIGISTTWRRYRFIWVPPTGTTVNQLKFGLVSGTGTFQIGRVRVYHAQEPVLSPRPDIQTFTADGTWVKRPGAQMLDIILIAAGAGGGSGRRGAAGTVRCGGGGGGAGAFARRPVPASLVGSTEPVTVGQGGAGGAVVTTDDTSGSTGAIGGNSRFGASAAAYGAFVAGGTAGGGGTASAGTAGAGGAGTVGGGAGGAASGTGGAGAAPSSSAGAGGGASGGGVTSGDAVSAGGIGGGANGSGTITPGGSGGTSGGGGGVAGTAAAAGNPLPGAGGGGGGSSITGAGGNGAAGSIYGSGAGGGGASLNGSSSGAGGTGGSGFVMVITYF